MGACYTLGMPIIRIDFDKNVLDREKINQLSEAVQVIVSEATGIEDVFVYADAADITYKIAPIEIFIEMSANAIKDQDALMSQVRQSLSSWKQASGFESPINLTLIPMNWKIEINI